MRKSESLVMLGPVLERIYDEGIKPVIERTWAMMVRANIIPPAPAEIQGKDMNIEFVSPILQNHIFKTYIGIKNIGRTSLTLLAEIRKHSVHTEKETVSLKSEAVFVRINEEGEAIPISDTIRAKFGYKRRISLPL